VESYENIRLPWPDWKIVKYLGGGAYGKVYEIERNIAGIREEAALKIVSRPKDSEEVESCYDNGYDKESIVATYNGQIQDCVKEYQTMKELQGQSNIVSCDDFTVVPNPNGIGGQVFIRMELLTSLQQVLRERPLSVDEIIKLGKDISSALILCESKNIVHRDIKPTNIMVSRFGGYKLGDFGVSKTMDHTTFATAMGTPEYQAPEVVHMEKYGSTADIYSLGITLYWLLNNRKMPFIGADEKLTYTVETQATERRYRGERLPEPKNGSAELKRIVLKSCEYRPQDRYASAKELYDALDALNSERASEPSENNSQQRSEDTYGKGKDLHKNIFVSEDEIGRSKRVSVQYADGREKSFEVNVPGDIKSGQSIRLRGQGTTAVGEQAGDLFLDVTVTDYHESTTYHGQDETNSWGESFATIGNPGGKPHNDKAQAESFTAETVGKQDFVQKKKPEKKQEEKQKKKQEEKVSSGSETYNALKVITEYNPFTYIKRLCFVAGVFMCASGFMNSSSMQDYLIGGIITISISLLSAFLDFPSGFGRWMRRTKKQVQNIDDLIRTNTEFAIRLYCERCPNRHMLKYIEKLNPAAAGRLKASRK
jgi:serine/threonine protein kinase